MTGKIDFEVMQTASNLLFSKKNRLHEISEKLRRARRLLAEMSYTESIDAYLSGILQRLERQEVSLQLLAKCPEECKEIYLRMENAIADRYSLDMITYPKMHCGVNEITGMEAYDYLLPFEEKSRI